LNRDFQYGDWGHGDAARKATYVLDPSHPQNFWWLEDPLSREEMKALAEAGKLDQYVRVEPYGQWGFLDGVNELFRRKGITDNDIKKVQGKPEWFKKEAILSENPCKENVRETLTMLKFIAGSDTIDPEKRLKEVQEYIANQLYTVYK
jgi:hypothetical protein